MSLTQEQILHIAKISRLSPTPEEIEARRKDLSSSIDYVDILKKVSEEELKNIDLARVSGLIPRPDIEMSETDPDALLACSPKRVVNHQIAIDNIMN